MNSNIVKRYPTVAPLSRQRGVASLLVSIVILSALTTATVYTAKSIMTEQKISNNTYRAQQAFEAAEAGISAAISYFAEDPDRDRNNVLDALFDTDADGIGDDTNGVIGASNRVVVTVTDLDVTVPPTFSRLQIVSQGFSDDDSATRTITQIISNVDPLPNVPDNPMTTRGTVTITGSATVYNPEGHSTIWSGGDIELGSNNSTATEIADVNAANYPGCMDTPKTCNTVPSSNKLTMGLDVIEYDSSLGNLSAAEFFENFFGMSPTLYRESMVTLETTPANADTDIDLATNEVIWVEGTTSFSAVTVGCASSVMGSNDCPTIADGDATNDLRPSVLIVNGDATFNGSPHFYGIVFVTGTTTISGNTTVEGSLVSAGALNNQSGGSLDITYNSGVLDRTRQAGSMSASSGSWRDL